MAGKEALRDDLSQAYELPLFIKNVLRPVFGTSLNVLNPKRTIKDFTKSERDVIQSVECYAELELSDGLLECYEVILHPKVKLEYNRISIQHFIRNKLTTGNGALINFVHPDNNQVWRFSFIARTSEIEEGKIQEHKTHAKRYTYLLGPSESCRTAAERFENLSAEPEIDLEKLADAFSVEKLSDDFFDEYKSHYQNFVEYLTGKRLIKVKGKWEEQKTGKPSTYLNTVFINDEKAARDFCKKLLGRIVFLYFVQKKRWLGASDLNYIDGKIDFLDYFFHSSGGGDDFYSTALSKLFFDTLNNPNRKEDEFILPDKSKVKIPFLNGGLFEKEKYDNKPLYFPSKLFHNHKEEDIPLKRGFFDFLRSYNFTIYEDSPYDHTVAVDPEMLGRIFENLLEDNKDKGAYYTPKPVVHYMCQESLIEYLNTELNKESQLGYQEYGKSQTQMFGNEIKKGQLSFIDELTGKKIEITREEIELFIKQNVVTDSLKLYGSPINKALSDVKICDPAVGSGAFPMGLLMEIYFLKLLLRDEIKLPELKNVTNAKIKEDIIQNSIYGVDIEKGAVDIARLRFWLSLIVDEEKPRVLPNLDYKIVKGDSLSTKLNDEIIEVVWSDKTIHNKEARPLYDNIQKRLNYLIEQQKIYFDCKENKEKLQIEIRNLKIDVLISQLEIDIFQEYRKSEIQDKLFHITTTKEIKEKTDSELRIVGFKKTIRNLENLKNKPDKVLDFFEWKLDFPEIMNSQINDNVGFDIVIANPPYLNIANISDDIYRSYLQQNYQTVKNKSDLYSIFIEKTKFLSKQNAIICFIYPKTWMGSDSFSKFREFITNNYKILSLINLGYGIFENATVSTVISVFSKNYVENHNIKLFQLEKNIIGQMVFIPQENYLSYSQIRSTSQYLFSFTRPINIKINTIPLCHLVDFSLGIKTSDDSKFIINYKRDDDTYPMLRGKNIRRYENDHPSEFIWYKPSLMMKKTGAGPRRFEYFIQDKILIQGICNGVLKCTLDTNKYLVNDKIHIAFNPKSYSLNIILAILNSSLMSFITKSMFGNYLEIKINQLELLPFPATINSTIEFKISNLVNERLKSINLIESQKIEKQLNAYIYHLYEIKFEDAKTIDSELIEEDFNKYKFDE